jgi:hypothetical protein
VTSIIQSGVICSPGVTIQSGAAQRSNLVRSVCSFVPKPAIRAKQATCQHNLIRTMAGNRNNEICGLGSIALQQIRESSQISNGPIQTDLSLSRVIVTACSRVVLYCIGQPSPTVRRLVLLDSIEMNCKYATLEENVYESTSF